MKKIILAIVSLFSLLILGAIIYFGSLIYETRNEMISANNFEECSRFYPVIESFPRQCKTQSSCLLRVLGVCLLNAVVENKTFVEDIGNVLEKTDLIRLTDLQPNRVIKNPLKVTGEARGFWFFEAVFPVKLLDGNGNVIGQGQAQALSEWMTDNFVPFEATIEFQTPATVKGTLVLEKDNPSGLPQNSDQLEFPVRFK